MFENKYIKISVSLLCCLVLLFFINRQTTAQNSSLKFVIEKINDQNFPKMEVVISITDAQGLPVKDLSKNHFTLSEDNQPVAQVEVTPFSDQSQPLAVVLIVDTSESMKYGSPAAIELARKAGQQFLEHLTPQDQVALLSFSDDPFVVEALTTDKVKVNLALDKLTPNANTALYDAVVEGVGLLQNVQGRKVVVLITDGKDSGKGISTKNLDQAITTAVQAAVPIFPIGFGDVDEEALNRMAQLSGGYTQIQKEPAAIQSAFNLVLEILRQKYTLRYTSTLAADKAEHTLAIKLAYQAEQLEQSKTFVAVPNSLTIDLPEYVDGQEVAGTIRFEPKTLSKGDIQKVEVWLNGVLKETLEKLPFVYTLDTTTLNPIPGEHEIKFIAYDAEGLTNSVTRRFKVAEPFLVSIISPKSGSIFEKVVPLEAEVKSKNVELEKVIFLVNDKEVKSFSSPPFRTDWVAAGEGIRYKFSVQALDKQGHSIASPAVEFAIKSGGEGSGLSLIIAIIVILAALGVMLPLVFRKRKKRQTSGAAMRTYSREPGPAMPIHADIFPAADFLDSTSYVDQVTLPPDAVPHFASMPAGAADSLLEVQGLNSNHAWQLHTQRDVSLGRKVDENDIPLQGASASRRHAVIRFRDDVFTIFTLRPDNPIYVNGISTSQQHVLQSGDRIQIGESTFIFQ